MDNTKTDLLQTIQDQIAKEYRDSHDFPYTFWDDFEQDCLRYGSEIYYKNAWTEVCKRYAFEVAKAALNMAGERMPSHILCDRVKEESNIKL